MIGAYVHHHGRGHRQRVAAVLGCIGAPVTVFGSLDPGAPDAPPPCWPAGIGWTTLPRDDHPVPAPAAESGAGGTLHWAPLGHSGYRERMALLAAAAPDLDACWVDVSVEVAALWRVLGVPTVVTVQPGVRDDPPHHLAHRSAAALLAPWPALGPIAEYLEPVADRVHHVGGVSRFGGRGRTSDDSAWPAIDGSPRLLVLGGAGGDDTMAGYWTQVARTEPRTRITVLGGRTGTWVDDPWPLLCAADLVVTHAGLGAIADIACAGTPAVVVPARRPFGEQDATAELLRETGLATVRDELPDPRWWTGALTAAAADRETAARRWGAWGTAGAAGRAAALVESVARGDR